MSSLLASALPAADEMRPFRVDVPDAILIDLHDRLARTLFPNWIDGIGWEQGIEEATYTRLLDP